MNQHHNAAGALQLVLSRKQMQKSYRLRYIGPTVLLVAAWLALLLSAWENTSLAYSHLESRVIHVACDSRGGDGSKERPFSTINAALKAAHRGDTVAIGSGTYRERITVPLPDLRFTGAVTEENKPQVHIVAPENGNIPLLKDGKNSLWSGITFYSNSGPLLELRNFTGSFERCSFEQRGVAAAINIYGGTPVFKYCTFLGHSGPGAAINLNANDKYTGVASFTYCLFRDIEGAAILLRSDEDVHFINCLFANCGLIGMRYATVKSSITAVNSVFYLNSLPKLFLQDAAAPKVQIENCLYSPAPGEYMGWQAMPLDQQPEIEAIDCITASPRFEGGRHALVNLCVDDTANTPVWMQLTVLAEKLGLPITLALNTDALTDGYWETIKGPAAKGFELASHGAVHSSMAARETMRLGWFAPNANSAVLTIDKEKNFIITVDGQVAYTRNLGTDPTLTMAQLVRDLQEKDFRADLVDLSHGKIPAYLLMPVSDKDIFFERHAPELPIDSNAYMRYMLAESKLKIEEGMKRYKLPEQNCTVFVCPYAETQPSIVQAMDDTGFTLSRSRMKKKLLSARDNVDLYFIESVSLKKVFSKMPTDDLEEMFRMYLDHLKYHGEIMGFYAHGTNESSIEQWQTLIQVLAQEPMIQTVSLGEMERQIKKFCMPVGPGEYQCPSDKGPVRGEVSFRPAPNSPLLNAGKFTGQDYNFLGQPLTDKSRPNIGLY